MVVLDSNKQWGTTIIGMLKRLIIIKVGYMDAIADLKVVTGRLRQLHGEVIRDDSNRNREIHGAKR